jgi:hypothetical protein
MKSGFSESAALSQPHIKTSDERRGRDRHRPALVTYWGYIRKYLVESSRKNDKKKKP